VCDIATGLQAAFRDEAHVHAMLHLMKVVETFVAQAAPFGLVNLVQAKGTVGAPEVK
jgi:hypothetical protein